MTRHARLRRGNARERRIFDRRVAIAAIDAVAGDVAFVTELNGLLAGDARLRHPGGAIDLVEDAEKSGDEKDRADFIRKLTLR